MLELEKLPFVFVVGAARSGTTLLQMILDANPSVIFPLESKLIVHLKQKYSKVVNWTDKLIDEFIIDLYKERTSFAIFWNINANELRGNIRSFPINKLSFGILCKIIYLSYSSPFTKEKITLIGDKNPAYSVFIKELLEIFPDAKFIHVVRDYRDNVVSNRRTLRTKEINVLAQRWKIYNKLIELAKQDKSKNFYTLRYEDLVNDPEYYVSEICKFLDLKFSAEMLNFYEKIKITELRLQAIEEIQPNILQPINTSQINKWEKHLSNDEMELIDYICGDFAKKYNYIQRTKSKKWNYSIKSFIGFYKVCFVIRIKKRYYKMSFLIRDTIRVIEQKLYDWFKFSTYYNYYDFHFQRKKNK